MPLSSKDQILIDLKKIPSEDIYVLIEIIVGDLINYDHCYKRRNQHEVELKIWTKVFLRVLPLVVIIKPRQ